MVALASSLTCLESLHVEFMSYDEEDEEGGENDKVTDLSLVAIGDNLKMLRTLELAQWDRITDEGTHPSTSDGVRPLTLDAPHMVSAQFA